MASDYGRCKYQNPATMQSRMLFRIQERHCNTFASNGKYLKTRERVLVVFIHFTGIVGASERRLGGNQRLDDNIAYASPHWTSIVSL